MNSRSLRRLLGAAAAPALLLVTACGGASSTVAPSAAEPAATASSPAAGESLDAAGAVDAAALSERMITAIHDRQTARVTMTVTSVEGDMVAKGAVRYGPKKTQVRLGMALDGERTAMVLDGRNVYLRVPGANDGWVRISSDGKDPVSQAFAVMIESMVSNLTVDRTVEIFADLGLTEVGVGSIGGVPVTMYSYQVTPETVRASLPEGIELSDAEIGDVSGTVVMSVDETGLPHRIVSDVESAQDGHAKVVVRYTKWGEPVTIKAPATSELIEFPTS